MTTTAQLKVGMNVKCINVKDTQKGALEVGKTYTVAGISPDGRYIDIDDGRGLAWYSLRFEIVP